MVLKPLCARMPAGVTQTLLIMKLTAIIMLSACLGASANGHSQNVTLSLKDAPLEKVFKELQKQTGYAFVYFNDDLVNTKKINLDVKSASLENVLQLCVKDQHLTFTITDKIVVIKRSAVSPNEPTTEKENLPPPIDISGRITDEDGNPLMSATISVKGTNVATKTNADGTFVLKGVDENGTLEISYVGFEKKVLGVISFNGSKNLALKRSDSPLDVVQVEAYRTNSKRLSTSNIGTIKSDAIQKQPVANPLLALQGRIPGLFVTQSTGMPGSGVTVTIQGRNSLLKGNDPLYIVDGVPYISQLMPTVGGISLLGNSGSVDQFGNRISGSPLSFINPADIESIDVLKDADATAIYGSRAANGAILITTKKGKAGQTKVDVNVQHGWGKVARKLDLLNTRQYLQMRFEAKRNDNLQPTLMAFVPDYDLLFWDSTRNTDWQKKLIGGTSEYTDAQGSISGGNINTQFLIGVGCHRETTVFPGDLADQKGSLNFSINNSSLNKKFRVRLSGNYMIDRNDLIGRDITLEAMQLAPNAPELYNPDGTLNWAPHLGVSSWVNPLAYLYNKYKNKTNNLISNAVISYQILNGLEVKSSFGYTSLQTNETYINPLLSVVPERRPSSSRFASYGISSINTWIVEPQLNYKKTISEGKFETLIGATIYQKNSNSLRLFGDGHNSDLVLEDIKSASTVGVDANIISIYKYNALFGRVSYNWRDKYLINLNIRRDGSSHFGSESRFHNFWSIGYGWIFSNEKYINREFSFLSFGKLRGSYGSTGNDQIGDYQFLNLYSATSVGTAYQGATGLLPNGLPNPHLQWEETKKLQAGLDLGFLNDKILVDINYFHNRSSNQLLNYILPITTGFPGLTRNFPATIQNMGWEFSIAARIIKASNVSWEFDANLTVPKNKLIDFPNLEKTSYANSLIIGEPITISKAFRFLGVNQTTGTYQFADGKGGITTRPDTSTKTTLTVLINTLPTFYGGIHNNFRYKGFEIDVLFQYVKQKGQNNFFGDRPGAFTGGRFNSFGNQPVSVLDRWQQPGDITTIQRFNSNSSISQELRNAQMSDAAYSDASYLRLKNISLSWQLPEVWRQKAHLQNCKLYLQGQNLLTITNYRGLDPETRSSVILPPLRVWTMGIQAAF